MEFSLSQEQELFFDTAYSFGQEAIAPFAYEWEKQGTIPRDVLKAAGELGFGGLYVGEEHGGTGLSRLDATLVFEALSAACPSVASFISIHNMCTNMVAKYGTDALREAVLERLISLDAVASYCLTEPGAGSDAAALKARAVRTNDGYVLTGNKAFISGGGYSDVYVVMCRTGDDGPKGISTLVVENDADGLSFGAPEQKMGWKAQPTAQVQFDACAVAAANLLGSEGQGFSYAMEGLDGGRLNIAACALGGAQSAMDKALQYMGERQAFGKNLDSFQALQFRIADMET
ncbi:MAG: acyl-CoA dehydrogenase family protein, partial [Marinosulfonomonas sp.]|nr:acyl-CoA dehydrogenase family protein [Marinosulfonomonas sp.]